VRSRQQNDQVHSHLAAKSDSIPARRLRTAAGNLTATPKIIMSTPTRIKSRWTVEVLQQGADSEVRTQCASIRIRNTSAKFTLDIAPRNSSYRLPVAPGTSWGIDLADVHDELETVIIVYTGQHDSPVIVERIFKEAV
jgi:hypothetical protein